MRKQISNSPQSSHLTSSTFVIASSQTVKRSSGGQATTAYHAPASNNSASSAKIGHTKAPLKNNLHLKMAHPAVILQQELHKLHSTASQQQAAPRKTQSRPTTNHSSSQSHSEGKSSSSRGSGCANSSSANTPSKKGVKQRKMNELMIATKHSPKPRSQATMQLITASPNSNVSPKLFSHNLKNTNFSSKVGETVLVERHSIKKHTIQNSPTDQNSIRKSLIILNSFKPLVSPNEGSCGGKQNTSNKGAAIELAQSEKSSNQIRNSKHTQQDIDSVHQEYLNQTLDVHADAFLPKHQILYANAPQNFHLQKSPSASIKPARSPPSNEKIVIKKSEIRFGQSISPQNNLDGKLSPKIKIPTEKKHIQAQDIVSKSTLAFDVIKKMINDHPPGQNSSSGPKGGSPKKDGISSPLAAGSILRLSLSGNNSPSSISTKQKIQKSQINFVHDMKKHGIQKDLESVKAMKQFLNSNSPQSVSPNLMMTSQNKIGGSAVPKKQPEQLQIKTSFKYEELEELKNNDETLGSGKSQESISYQFPFHKRSRSGSPPFKDDAASHQASISSQALDQHPMLLIEELRGQEDTSVFARTSQRVTTLTQQKSTQRITPGANGGPVIAERQSMESVIQAAGVGSPGNIFFGQDGKSTFSFSLKKHSKSHKNKAQSHREQEELERRIMSGTEVEEWLESPQRVETAAVAAILAMTDEELKLSYTLANHQQRAYHHFSNLGFIGDIDDLEEDEIEKDMAGNDDWMFQTFQKMDGKFHQPRTELKHNDTPDERINDELLPQNLLISLDLGDNQHILIDEEQKIEEQISDADIDDGEIAIPSEKMDRISSQIADHALEFPRQHQV